MKSRRMLFAMVLIWSYPAVSNNALAEALNVINTLRTKECERHLTATQTLKRNAKLATAGKYINDGLGVRDALQRAEYRADQSAVIQFGGAVDDAVLKRMLMKSYCATLTDTGLVEVGIFASPRSTVLLFAAPFAPPAPNDAPHIANQVLHLVNEARGKSRRCGSRKLKAVAPLKSNEQLRIAAVAHAKDMAKRGVVTHDGADGSSPGDRATRAGYVWQSVGENVAGGQLTAKEVVDGWLASPHHCVNIMDADFTQMAVAYAINPKQEIGIYWAQEFGRPR